jgi:hypothetical protein
MVNCNLEALACLSHLKTKMGEEKRTAEIGIRMKGILEHEKRKIALKKKNKQSF